jgi:hypothetical protein
VRCAVAACKAGADQVVLIERSDEPLGTGLVGGIMRNNGRHHRHRRDDRPRRR